MSESVSFVVELAKTVDALKRWVRLRGLKYQAPYYRRKGDEAPFCQPCLTLRMQLRRFTRLTNAHSRKLENLKHAVTLYMAWYNFCRVHQTIRVTPAMQAEITDYVWTIAQLLDH